jgi:enhancing lycopene biosynthesis protein 2
LFSSVNEAHTDENNKVVTAPAYMYDAKIDEVDAGIAQMVEQTLALLSAAATKA